MESIPSRKYDVSLFFRNIANHPLGALGRVLRSSQTPEGNAVGSPGKAWAPEKEVGKRSPDLSPKCGF